jgi:hypothetical protein
MLMMPPPVNVVVPLLPAVCKSVKLPAEFRLMLPSLLLLLPAIVFFNYAMYDWRGRSDSSQAPHAERGARLPPGWWVALELSIS